MGNAARLASGVYSTSSSESCRSGREGGRHARMSGDRLQSHQWRRSNDHRGRSWGCSYSDHPLQGLNCRGLYLSDLTRRAYVNQGGSRSTPDAMRHPDSSGLTAAGARREKVRLQTVAVFGQVAR